MTWEAAKHILYGETMFRVLLIWSLLGVTLGQALCIDRDVSWRYFAVMCIVIGPPGWCFGLFMGAMLGVCALGHWVHKVTKDKTAE